MDAPIYHQPSVRTSAANFEVRAPGGRVRSNMARVAIVSYDVQTIYGKAGSVGAFTTHWANLLRQAGEAVTIVITGVDLDPMRVDTEWRARYQMNEISVIELQAPAASPTRWPEVPTMRMSEIVAPVLGGFDVVYFQDWGNAAFHLVRQRRYTLGGGPVCVTVLHGPSEWLLSSDRKYPDLPNDLHLAYGERYSTRHSDFVISPTRYMADHLQTLGWQFPGQVEVLGLPMPEPTAVTGPTSSPRIRRIVYFGINADGNSVRTFLRALQLFSESAPHKPDVVLLASPHDPNLLRPAMRSLKQAGYAASERSSLNVENAWEYLRDAASETLCVIPDGPDAYRHAVEGSLIPGLNLIACRNAGVPEILREAQLFDSLPRDLADKIAERVNQPLAAPELARYDCRAANARWLEFHRKTVAWGQERRPRTLPDPKPTVDVCMTYYQKPEYLQQLVEALESQTETDFHVIAVNDGSPDEKSNRVFDEQAKSVASKGWHFYRQENAFVDAARNSAAQRGTGDLILFVDSDDVPARHAVARMREAITLSGDDALICADYLFAGDKRPFDPATGDVLVPAYATCIPLGMDLVGGLLNPAVFGGSMFIIRRSVFEKVGGFRELRGAGHEDWELYVRLSLAGYKVDILPELLHYYRQVEGGLARTMSADAAQRRLLDAYEGSLRAVGLEGGALALLGLYRNTQDMEKNISQLSIRAASSGARYAFFSKRTNAFVSDSGAIERLRHLYRSLLPLETRVKFHDRFLAPFVGPRRPRPE